MNTSIASKIVALVVCVLITVSVAVPIISSTTSGLVDTYYNGGVTEAQEYDSSPVAHTASFTAGGTTFTVDGTSYNMNNVRMNIILTDTFQLWNSTNGFTLYLKDDSTGTYTCTTSTAWSVTTTSAGSASITFNGETYTKTFTWDYVRHTGGDYVFCAANTVHSPYVKSTDSITALILNGSQWVLVKDGVGSINGTEKTLTFTTSVVAGTNNTIYQVSGITLDAYSPVWVIAPFSETYSEGLDGSYAALLNVIPLLMIVGLALMAIAEFISKRD